MNCEAQYLLKVLRAFLSGEKPGAFHGSWDSLISLARIHSVSGIVGSVLMNERENFSSEKTADMRRMCMNTILLQAHRAECMQRLSALLDENGIDHLMFKGYVVKEYYPVPELRNFGDIDLLIRPQDRMRCHQLMLEQGYKTKTDWEPVYSYQRDSEFYEFHTDVMEVDVSDKADYKAYFRQIWDYAVPQSGHVWQLKPEFHFLYLLTHIAKHISGSGAGIRMYLDLAAFIRCLGDKIDWSWVTGELDKLKLRDFANMALTVAEKYFAAQSPLNLKAVDEETLADFMDFTMEGGTFGYYGRDAGVVSLKTQGKNTNRISRAGTFMHRLFPSADSIKTRYTYLQKAPWLLPVAWADRLFRTRKGWTQHAREAKSIMTADAQKALKLRRIYKELGF